MEYYQNLNFFTFALTFKTVLCTFSFIFIIWTYMVNTYKTYTNKITALQNKAVKLISNSKRTDKCSPIYKNVETLQIQDLHFFETAMFMFKFCSKKLPRPFSHHFTPISEIHSVNTRSNTSGLKYYIPRFKTERLLRFIKYVGAEICTEYPIPSKIAKLKTHLHNN